MYLWVPVCVDAMIHLEHKLYVLITHCALYPWGHHKLKEKKIMSQLHTVLFNHEDILNWKNKRIICRIWGFHSSDYEERRLLRCGAMSAATCSCWFLARRFFYPEDGGDTLVRNVSSLHRIYTEPHPRRWHSSKESFIYPHCFSSIFLRLLYCTSTYSLQVFVPTKRKLLWIKKLLNTHYVTGHIAVCEMGWILLVTEKEYTHMDWTAKSHF
jgi:hypothetical protein